MQFSKDIVKKVRCGQPIEAYGLTLYPIMMEDYTDFLLCKDAFAIMQGSLPARYLGMDFVSALFVYSMDEAANGVPPEQRTSLFQRMISLVYLTLRSTKEEIEQIAPVTHEAESLGQGKRISLGRRILRTETAGLATLAMLIFCLDE